ncbi:hypothetical protein KCU73_g7, partial [Aureobasidium melanogenum]
MCLLIRTAQAASRVGFCRNLCCFYKPTGYLARTRNSICDFSHNARSSRISKIRYTECETMEGTIREKARGREKSHNWLNTSYDSERSFAPVGSCAAIKLRRDHTYDGGQTSCCKQAGRKRHVQPARKIGKNRRNARSTSYLVHIFGMHVEPLGSEQAERIASNMMRIFGFETDQVVEALAQLVVVNGSFMRQWLLACMPG